ncbi:hypothetical protein L2E82_22651 [Cichorium intybus]|uniref:Uncharacterized protein n=1 Tax=Cichorium intybus TaxID=13427 RepID=A0ACB9DYC5_CICIN|nr:hypothetical protein L2E82_22651 [Cichorium intybus]
MNATALRRSCLVKATPSSTSSIDMEGAKESEEKSDVYSTNMTEAMGAVLTYRHELGMNYDFITPDLIVGSCLQTPADVDKLRSIGVKTIFCLQQDSDLEYFSVDIGAIREYASTFNDIEHIRAEIRDFDAFDMRLRLPYVVSKLHKAINRNGGIAYIHCTAGLGRAPATALAYMFWVQVDSGQWTVDSGQWTVDSGQWTVDSGQWTVDSRQTDGFADKLQPVGSSRQADRLADRLHASKRSCFPKVDAIKSATADILTGLKKKPVTLTWKADESSTVEISGLDIGWGQKIPLKYDKKAGSWILQKDLPVSDNDTESVSSVLWGRLGSDDFDLTSNERDIVRRFLDECPDDEFNPNSLLSHWLLFSINVVYLYTQYLKSLLFFFDLNAYRIEKVKKGKEMVVTSNSPFVRVKREVEEEDEKDVKLKEELVEMEEYFDFQNLHIDDLFDIEDVLELSDLCQKSH